MTTSKKKPTKAKVTAAQFDHAFERGEQFEMLDLEHVTVHAPMQRINIDIPKHILHQTDNEANRIGVPRTSILKLWIVEKLSQLKGSRNNNMSHLEVWM